MTATLFLVCYQPPGIEALRELVCWTDNPLHARTHADLRLDPELGRELRAAVDADALAHFGARGGEIARISTLALEGVQIVHVPEARPDAPAHERCRPAPLLEPQERLGVWHIIPDAPEPVYWGAENPDPAQASVLCLAPTPHAALVSAWSLAAFDPAAPSLSPCRDLAQMLGGWQKGVGLWPSRSELYPVAVRVPQQDPNKIRTIATRNASRGLLAFRFPF